MELEGDLGLPLAGAVDGSIVVNVVGRAESGVVGRPGGARRGGGAQVASTVDASTAAGGVRRRAEATVARVSAPQADCRRHSTIP